MNDMSKSEIKISSEGEFIIINPLSSTNRKVVVKEVALHDTPYFKFNELYNNNNPIPMVEMYGVLLEEKNNCYVFIEHICILDSYFIVCKLQ